MTAGIGDKIARRIRAEGPLTIAAYMAMALHDPEAGYYATRDPIGSKGDFTTGPEISQIFGELIGLWCADLWQRLGQPEPIILAELGPGRGVLMTDVLRAASRVPGFRRALRIHLVETSPLLRAEQERRLGNVQPVWLTRAEDLPDGAMLLIANEFLDALPVRQFIRSADLWSERLVGLDPTWEFAFVAGPPNLAATLLVPAGLRDAPPGTVVEICPAALALAGALGTRLAHQPGAALFIDYGHFPSAAGPTLRGLSRHHPISPLAAPGASDLSAHVDFAAFAEAARISGGEVYGPVTQGRFLAALGAAVRLAALSATASPAQRRRLESGVRRLLEPAQMGDLFKALAIASPGLPVPAGFTASTTAAQ